MTNKTLALYIALIAWAIAFFSLGMVCAKAENWVTSPSKLYMPGNIYNTAIINSTNTTNTTSNSKFDSCKNPGTVVKIVVDKSAKTMQLLDVNDCVVKQYEVRVGYNKGPKQCEGDKKTPEGTYKIKDKRDSKYVRFLELDYPRPKDLVKAEELGCNPGNAIGIHYFNQDVMDKNTQYSGSNGCITVWNKDEIREISRLVRVGTEVVIKP